MKNKKLTYVLIFAVLAIWSIIIVRIFNNIKPEVYPENKKIDNFDNNISLKDSIVYLNYEDPFKLSNNKTILKANKRHSANNKSIESESGRIDGIREITHQKKGPRENKTLKNPGIRENQQAVTIGVIWNNSSNDSIFILRKDTVFLKYK